MFFFLFGFNSTPARGLFSPPLHGLEFQTASQWEMATSDAAAARLDAAAGQL